MQKTCIVIPCYNEGNRLDTQDFLHYAVTHPHIFFLFVNDGSTDQTAQVLMSLKAANEHQFRFIDRTINLGKAESVREGILKSSEWHHFDYIGYFDADLATPLQEIEWLLSFFNGNPDLVFVLGSRQNTGENTISRNKLRHSFGRIYAEFITTLLRLDIYDTQCGAKILRYSIAKEIMVAPFIDRWLFDVELICRLRKRFPDQKRTIKEVALREWSEKGHSRIRKIDLLKLPYKTSKIFFKYLSIL